MNELLPIGSIVVLKGNMTYMIIGFFPSSLSSDVTYDYIVCHPNGLVKQKEELKKDTDFFYIKKEEIKNVLYIGFQDEEFDIYIDIMTSILEQLKELKQSKKEITSEEIKSLCSSILNKMCKRWIKNER